MADPLPVMDMPMAARRRLANVTSFNPLTLLSALPVLTERVGLIATASTTYNEPYHVARRFASSRGSWLRSPPGSASASPSAVSPSHATGHLSLQRGRVSLNGRDIAGPHPDRGIVFQHHTLFAWRSVLDDVAFGPKTQWLAKGERGAGARDFLA